MNMFCVSLLKAALALKNDITHELLEMDQMCFKEWRLEVGMRISRLTTENWCFGLKTYLLLPNTGNSEPSHDGLE